MLAFLNGRRRACCVASVDTAQRARCGASQWTKTHRSNHEWIEKTRRRERALGFCGFSVVLSSPMAGRVRGSPLGSSFGRLNSAASLRLDPALTRRARVCIPHFFIRPARCGGEERGCSNAAQWAAFASRTLDSVRLSNARCGRFSMDEKHLPARRCRSPVWLARGWTYLRRIRQRSLDAAASQAAKPPAPDKGRRCL